MKITTLTALFALAILTTACAAIQPADTPAPAHSGQISVIGVGQKAVAHDYEVIDGDTVHFFIPQRLKVRLIGIDTPERDQRHGMASKDKLKDILDGASAITVHTYDTDQHGRALANILIGEDVHLATRTDGKMISVNALLVEAGLAYPYLTSKLPDEALKSQIHHGERKARKNALGVHGCADCLKPWDHRKETR